MYGKLWGILMVDFNTKISAASYQERSSNFTTIGVDNSLNLGNGSIGVYTGVGTNFNDNPMSAVIDLKGCLQYGNSPVSGGFRVRNNLNENCQTVQFRIQPCTVSLPVANNTSIYTTPYVATKLNYRTGDNKTSFGNYTGVSTKIGKASVFVEGQLYDLTKINKNTVGINIGVSIPING